MRERLIKLLGINRELATALASSEIALRKHIRNARIDAGVAKEDAAVRSGSTVEWIELMESLNYNPTLSELRYYLLGIGHNYTITLEKM